ncbi:TPA: class I SAM-dependent methyltransferase, partial [Streptococcus pyogenes]
MTKMYYDENPDSLHDIHEVKVELLNHPFTFLTDSGVFSKKMVDFGSQVLLKTLNFKENERVLDLGCGYGPLGISLAKVQRVDATLVDINNRALDLARKNATNNQVAVTIFQSN